MQDQAVVWDSIVTSYKLSGGHPEQVSLLEDCGADAHISHSLPIRVPPPFAEASQAFVKLTGSSRNRVPPSHATYDQVKGDGLHWAVSNKKRLRSVEDGDMIFVGRFTRAPLDIQIFGRAIGMKYQPGRDDATETDIEKRHWKAEYPRYIRVHCAEFVAGSMANGVSLYQMMDELNEQSFGSTQRNAIGGNRNPKRAYSQQGAVRLSEEGFKWLNERLQAAFETHGKIPPHELKKLDWPQS